MKPQEQAGAVGVDECPLCAAKIGGADHEVGEVVTCKGCDAELEIVGVSPLRLAEAPEVEEDWGE